MVCINNQMVKPNRIGFAFFLLDSVFEYLIALKNKNNVIKIVRPNVKVINVGKL
jgi:hypothetical protein